MNVTHRLSLSVGTTEAQWQSTFDLISHMAQELGSRGLPEVSVASFMSTDEENNNRYEELAFNQETMFKVYDAITELGIDDEKARMIITSMQNKGILFRERV